MGFNGFAFGGWKIRHVATFWVICSGLIMLSVKLACVLEGAVHSILIQSHRLDVI